MICMIVASGSRRINAATSSPPIRAERIDLLGDGRRETRHGQAASRAERVPIQLGGMDEELDSARGEANQCRTVSGTGNTASLPFSGSRMIPEKNPDAARFAFPGRTQIVGSRIPTPSRKPRRE